MMSLQISPKNLSEPRLHGLSGRSYVHKYPNSSSRLDSDIPHDHLEYNYQSKSEKQLDYPQFSNRYGKRQANEKVPKDKLPLKLPKIGSNNLPGGFGPLIQVFLSPKNQSSKLRNHYGMDSPTIRKEVRMFVEQESPKLKQDILSSMTLYNNILNKVLSPKAKQISLQKDIFTNKVAIQDQGYVALKKAREFEYNHKTSNNNAKNKSQNQNKKIHMAPADALLSERKKISPIFTTTKL